MAGDSDVTPIFQVSCVENTNLDLLRLLLNHLPSRRQFDVQKKKTQNGEEEEELEETTNKHGKDECGALVHLDDAFTVNGVGTVVSGVVTKGSISTNQQLLLGPDSLGHFKEVVVKSTMTHRTSVLKAVCGQSASFAIKAKNSKEPVHKADVRKGMAMICKSLHPRATWSFEAEILIFVSPTTLTVGYAPVLHCMSVRQCARICKIEGKDVLRAGDRAKVIFQWLYRPEFVEEGFRVIFREGRTRGLGSITKVSFDGDKQKSWPDSRKQLHGTNMEAMMNTATATKSAG
jgi:GTPase